MVSVELLVIIPGWEENQTHDKLANENPHMGFEELTVGPGVP